MTLWKDNTAGWVSTVLWLVYYKMKDDNGNEPSTLALCPELHERIMELKEDCRRNTMGSDGKPAPPYDKFMNMDVVCDESLTDGRWEMRW